MSRLEIGFPGNLILFREMEKAATIATGKPTGASGGEKCWKHFWRVRKMIQNLDVYLEEEPVPIYKRNNDFYQISLRSNWNDWFDLYPVAALHEKVEKKIISYFHEKLVQKLLGPW